MSRQAIAIPAFNFGVSRKFWIVLAVVLWLYFVISHIPAVWGAYLMTRSGEVAMSGVSGSIWSGRASLASIKVKDTDYSLGQLTWKLDFFSLFILKPCAQLTTQMDNQQFEGHVCAGRNNALSVRDATANFPSVLLKPLIPLQIEGQLSVQIDTLQMQANQLDDLRAKLSWSDAKVFNGSNWMSLGGFGVDLVDDDKKGLSAHIIDVNSPIHLDAVITLLSPSGGSVKGTMSMAESFQREANASAWLSMFAVAQPVDEQGKINYTLDVNL